MPSLLPLAVLLVRVLEELDWRIMPASVLPMTVLPFSVLIGLK